MSLDTRKSLDDFGLSITDRHKTLFREHFTLMENEKAFFDSHTEDVERFIALQLTNNINKKWGRLTRIKEKLPRVIDDEDIETTIELYKLLTSENFGRNLLGKVLNELAKEDAILTIKGNELVNILDSIITDRRITGEFIKGLRARKSLTEKALSLWNKTNWIEEKDEEELLDDDFSPLDIWMMGVKGNLEKFIKKDINKYVSRTKEKIKNDDKTTTEGLCKMSLFNYVREKFPDRFSNLIDEFNNQSRTPTNTNLKTLYPKSMDAETGKKGYEDIVLLDKEGNKLVIDSKWSARGGDIDNDDVEEKIENSDEKKIKKLKGGGTMTGFKVMNKNRDKPIWYIVMKHANDILKPDGRKKLEGISGVDIFNIRQLNFIGANRTIDFQSNGVNLSAVYYTEKNKIKLKIKEDKYAGNVKFQAGITYGNAEHFKTSLSRSINSFVGQNKEMVDDVKEMEGISRKRKEKKAIGDKLDNKIKEIGNKSKEEIEKLLVSKGLILNKKKTTLWDKLLGLTKKGKSKSSVLGNKIKALALLEIKEEESSRKNKKVPPPPPPTREASLTPGPTLASASNPPRRRKSPSSSPSSSSTSSSLPPRRKRKKN